jgi:hypothetical protein
MPNPYMDALKKFNEGKSGWCVPRKGTADYQKVMSLMRSATRDDDADSFISQESNPRRALNEAKSKAKFDPAAVFSKGVLRRRDRE